MLHNHNKQKDKAPTTANKKQDIRNRLDEHNIQYDDKDIKKTLLDKVRQHRPEKLYLTDDAAHQHGHGHTVLRLPVAHCKLNPIELAWASVKGYVAKHNKTFTFKEIQQLTPDGITHTTTDMWRAFCRHVVDIENDFFDKDGLLEDAIEDMVIEVGGSADDDTDDDDDGNDSLVDDEDRRIIDQALRQLTDDCTQTPTSTKQTKCSTPTATETARHELLSTFQDDDRDYLESVLPLP